jgi:hypothetical protein
MPLPKVFAKAGLDNVTSAMCKHHQWFGLDVQCSALVHNFNNIFSIGICTGQTSNEFPAFANTRTLAATIYGESES